MCPCFTPLQLSEKIKMVLLKDTVKTHDINRRQTPFTEVKHRLMVELILHLFDKIFQGKLKTQPINYKRC